MPTNVGILTFMSMINFVLGWVEHGKRFYNLGSNLGQQQYSLPKIKLIIGHPKTSSKQIIMFLPDLQKKRACLIDVLRVLKRTASVEKINTSFALTLSGDVFIMIIRVREPTIVGILTFVSMINVVLGWVERGKGFITSGFVWVNKSIVSRK